MYRSIAYMLGFTVASIVNIDFDRVDAVLLCIYSISSAATICCLIFAAVTSSYLLISVYKYDIHKTNIEQFDRYWKNYCEEDWKNCFNCLNSGVFLFVVVLVEISWIVTANHKDGNSISISVTILVLIFTCLWFINVYSKWSNFLRNGVSKYPVNEYRQESPSSYSLKNTHTRPHQD